MKQLVLFASGSGSNVENIFQYFKNDSNVNIQCVLTNNKDAKVIERCQRLKIPVLYFNRMAFSKTEIVLNTLKAFNPDLIVLAGFLWKIPESFVHAFPNKIINIHPALLPKYGGKGMYGAHVHHAVKKNNETETGITIHYVNEYYDDGAIIHQAKTILTVEDTPNSIAEKVHSLEYEFFPKVIADILLK
ncbi:phosphoribosylglycinamide formyltransferase [Flavobacterium sp. ASW18X]|uniref:phosphoribosylglycinamide formyltransferase n=1 Tax=Flavobacterium sp. ASW18X TaxID=2572595 RepID=UPI0010AEC730|nr:phosphoribosylglycinamide formyltransferase [Flavobacterium sp. ASW18X]TKD65221.1 phosphoribosylglycinamide formyltransferase [Flavobacterium sp. ASW18X]